MKKKGFYKKPKVLIEENSQNLVSLSEELSNFELVSSNQVVQKTVYYGIVCVCCNVSPIVGEKFSCVQCWKKSEELISICEDCFNCEDRMKLLDHPSTHRFNRCKRTAVLDLNSENNEKQYLF